VSIAVVLAAIAIPFHFSTEYFSALGSLFGATAGMLAVIWFSASLHYQSQQLKEQRQQFVENFKQLREDNRRSSLVLVRDILSRAEERALKSNPDLKSINDLMTHYMNILEWGDILKSKDPDTVLEAGKKWLTTKEGPALFLMRGIKSAAETYFRAIGMNGIDYTIEPELFVAVHGPTLWKVPYFDEYQAVGAFLSETMPRLKPGRERIQLAYWVAALKKSVDEDLHGVIKEEKIMEDIKQYVKAGRTLPAIAQDLAEGLRKDS
jgi:hypothetical protein